ncbi:MAG: hypothetical protein KIT11_05120 [Fimbriimonadaceae bacterium]|nr:hypothetical protein [Fimbriimonadaceae bacterium]QYK56726.1 MAG: hypothetical protein KF733_04400 [Fimbriimonadaceae bacterium]
MKYYVIWPDGQKFGPADVDTLTQWAAEGRITPSTELESVDTGARAPASSVPGIIFSGPAAAAPSDPGPSYPGLTSEPSAPGPSAPYAAPDPYQYPPSSSGAYAPMNVGDDGGGDVTKSFILSAVGLFCCCFASPAAVYFANEAKKKGNPNAQAAFIVSLIVLGLVVIGSIFYAIAFATGVIGGIGGLG